MNWLISMRNTILGFYNKSYWKSTGACQHKDRDEKRAYCWLLWYARGVSYVDVTGRHGRYITIICVVSQKYVFTSFSFSWLLLKTLLWIIFLQRELFLQTSYVVVGNMVHVAIVAPTPEGEQVVLFVKTFLIFDSSYGTQ